jgi:3-deoxy-D-manno-octulosonate 8-phosphate phosphatase (KDO 8-P phosphatase)
MGAATPKLSLQELTERAARVRLLVFDVDGVLTDGGMYYGESGEALKRFDVKDGHGLVMARLAGLRAAVISARTSPLVDVRTRELGFAAVLQGRRFKGPALRELLAQLEVSPEACAYMGDDVNDLGPMALVGLSACPADAAPEVLQAAHFVSQRSGGHGAARELVELCLKAGGHWERLLEDMRDTDDPGTAKSSN